jgi:phosphatidylglycerol:prolipoprotein diacylglycerol transferase
LTSAQRHGSSVAVLPSLPLPLLGGTVSAYALVRAAYLYCALVLVLRLNARQGIAARVTLTAFALGVPAGVLGAHVLDMVEYWGRHGGLRDVLSATGSSIYGAFLAIVPLVWLYVRSQGVSPLRFLDAGAPAMALGEAMTRVGCFLNGCCYGIPWKGPLAVVFPRESFAYADQIARGLLPAGAEHSLPVFPAQLVSSGLAWLAFFGLLRLFRRPHAEGQVFHAFLVFYGALRLGMAPLRQEALASMVVFSVGFLIVGAVGLLLGRRGVAHSAHRPRRLSPVR